MSAQVIRKKNDVIVLIPIATLNQITRDCEVSIAGDRLSPDWGYPLDSLKPCYHVTDNPSEYRGLVRGNRCSLNNLQLQRILKALTY